MRTVILLFAIISVITASSLDELINERINVKNVECNEPHQKWSGCASVCEPQCNNFKGEKCPAAITEQCIVNTCVCEEGSARIEENKCLPLDSEECGGLYDTLSALKLKQKN